VPHFGVLLSPPAFYDGGWTVPIITLGFGANGAGPFLLSPPAFPAMIRHVYSWWRSDLEGKQRLSWAPEAMTDSGNWAGNGLRFATKEEAEMYVAQFSSARNTRVIESFEPVNYRWQDGRLVRQE
jgi:hypothetical protein